MRIGHLQTLTVARVDTDRLVLQDESGEGIDLPRDSTVPACAVGDTLPIFLHTDREGRPVATHRQPFVTLGRCAALKAVADGPGGSFLDWGLDKHLLLPFGEQRRPVRIGQLESVLVYRDNSGRLAATSRLDTHLDLTPAGFVERQAVELLVFQRTELGFKAVVDDRAIGLLYADEVFRNLGTGTRLPGFIRRVRPDGRLDVTLQPPGGQMRDELEHRVLAWLSAGGGSGELTDRSSPEEIQREFQVSKKNFKRALSSLYKARRIRLEPDRTVLVDQSIELDLGGDGAPDR